MMRQRAGVIIDCGGVADVDQHGRCLCRLEWSVRSEPLIKDTLDKGRVDSMPFAFDDV